MAYHTATLRVTFIFAAAMSLFVLVIISLRTKGFDISPRSFPMLRARVLMDIDGSTPGRVCSNMKCLQDGSAEKAIVTMTKTADGTHPYSRLKNLLASIQHFYTSNYTVIIFTDMDFNATLQADVRECTDLNIVFVKIDLFKYMSNVTIEQAKLWEAGKDGGIKGRPIGYRLMCRFWSKDIFRHPVIRNLKYIMRLDDDSYFPFKMEEDPFDVMEKENLEYGYRAWFGDASLMHNLWPLSKAFLNKNPTHVDMNAYGIINGGKYGGKAIYNNFFIAKPELWRQPLLKSYLQHLVDNHGFLKYKIGDANVHAFIVTLAVNRTKSKHFKFAYNHNCHIHSKGSDGFAYMGDYSKWQNMLKCRHITVANLNNTFTTVGIPLKRRTSSMDFVHR